MNIGRSISFPFRGPHAWANLGCMLVCLIIPVVGALVASGYLIVVEKQLVQNIDSDGPRFNFSRFSDYLTRGVWPFLVGMVLMMAAMPFFMVFFGAGFAAMVLLQDHPGWMIGVLVVAGVAYVSAIVLIGPLMAPLTFKAGVEGSFGAGFDWKFMVDFWKRVGWLSVGTHLLLMLLWLPAAIVALCVPYLGMFALIVVQMFVQAHLNTQIYLEYLNRGGRALAIVPEPPENAFEVVMPPAQRKGW